MITTKTRLTKDQFQKCFRWVQVLLTNPPKAKYQLNDGKGMCCLGVAGDLALREKWLKGTWNPDGSLYIENDGLYKLDTEHENDYGVSTPTALQNVFGFPVGSGFKIPARILERCGFFREDEHHFTSCNLTYVNDFITLNHASTALILTEFLFSEYVEIVFKNVDAVESVEDVEEQV